MGNDVRIVAFVKQQQEQGGKAIDGILNIWLKDENMGLLDAYLLKIQKQFSHYEHSIFVLNNIQALSKINEAQQFSVGADLTKAQIKLAEVNRIKSKERQTPTQSERKKSVSFSNPLEEIYIVESFKTTRPKSADKYRKRQRFDRNFIIPYSKQNVKKQDIEMSDDIISGSGIIAGELNNVEFQSNAPSILEIKSNIKCLNINTNIKSPKAYNSNLPSKNNNNSNSLDNSDQVIKTPQSQRNNNKRLFNLLSNDQILVPDLPTINEVPPSNKNQFNSTKDTTQSHLNKLQKRYFNGATPIKSITSKMSTNLFQNSPTMIQPYQNTLSQNLNTTSTTNAINNSKQDISNITHNSNRQIKHQYKPQKFQNQQDESNTNISSFIDKVFITQKRETRNNQHISNEKLNLKDKIFSNQASNQINSLKTPIKNTSTLNSKTPRTKPIPVYQSSNSNNTSITTQSNSPNIKKENLSSLNTSLNKSEIKTRNLNSKNSTNSAYKGGLISGSIIKLHMTSITPAKKTDKITVTKVESGLLNTSNSFLRLYNQSIKNIRTKDHSSQKMVSPPQIDKKEILDPNFFKRYLEVKSFLSNTNQLSDTLKNQNVTPQKTMPTKIETLKSNNNSNSVQNNLSSSFNLEKNKLKEFQQQSDLFIGDKRPKSRNNYTGISNTAQNIELNSSFQNTALKQFNNLTPKKQCKLDILSSIEYSHKQTSTLINERLNTLKMNQRKKFISPNSSVLMNKKSPQVDAARKLQKKQQDFSFNQSSTLIVGDTQDQINESSVIQQSQDITPEKQFITSPKNQGKSINNVNTIRSKIQLNSCRSSGHLLLNKSLDFKGHKIGQN